MQNELIFVGPNPNMTPDEGMCPGHKCTEGGPCENTGKMQPSACQRERLRERQLGLLGLQAHGTKKICFRSLSCPVCGSWSWQLLQTDTCLWEKHVFCRQKLLHEWMYSKPWGQSRDYKNRPFQHPIWCFYRFSYVFVKLASKSTLNWRDVLVDKVLVP